MPLLSNATVTLAGIRRAKALPFALCILLPLVLLAVLWADLIVLGGGSAPHAALHTLPPVSGTAAGRRRVGDDATHSTGSSSGTTSGDSSSQTKGSSAIQLGVSQPSNSEAAASVTCPNSASAASAVDGFALDFVSGGGSWVQRPRTDAGEPIYHWQPQQVQGRRSVRKRDATSSKINDPSSPKPPARSSCPQPAWRRFDASAAWRCLSGKRLLFVGNSNTRTLFTAFQSLLEGVPMMSRVSAKQLCDNTQTNHSCWMTLDPRSPNISRLLVAAAAAESGQQKQASSVTFRPIALHYVSFTRGMAAVGSELSPNRVRPHSADVLVMNVGVNFLLKMSDAEWRQDHHSGRGTVAAFAESAVAQGGAFVYHTTTPLCRWMEGFHRYKYKKSVYHDRTLEQTNHEILAANKVLTENILGPWMSAAAATTGASGPPLARRSVLVDGAAMVRGVLDSNARIPKGSLPPQPRHEAAGSGGSGSAAPFFDPCVAYDDPLHHRFLDRELVQVTLNHLCPP